MIKKVWPIVLVMLAAAGCASVNTKADEAAIAYKGGPIEGTHYNKVIDPGSGLVWLGVADDYYIYPTTQRDYIISRQAGEGDRANVDHIDAQNKDGVNIQWELAVYFKLNVSKLRHFHENVGLKYKAYFTGGTGNKSDGWDNMLNNVFRQQIESTIQRVSRNHNTDDIAKNAEIYGQLSAEVGTGLKDQINASFGNNYFCGPTFSGKVAEDDNKAECPDFKVVIKAVSLPDDVKKQYEAQKNAELSVLTKTREGDAAIAAAQKDAEAKVAAAEGDKRANEALAGLYKDPAFVAYIQAQAAKACAEHSDHCTMVVTPSGSGVNLNVSK